MSLVPGSLAAKAAAAAVLPQQKQWVELQLLCRGNVGKTRILQSLLSHYQKVSPQLQQQALPTVPDITLNIPRSIDLVQLYEDVVAKGGFNAVTESKSWASVALSMKLKIQASKLQALYATWLKGFEEQQIFGKKRKGLPTTDAFTEPIATHAEIQLTTSIRQTPLPVVTKRLKTHRQQLSDLGVLHRLVLALDSNLEDHIEWALNQLTVLSFGSTKDSDCDLLLAHVPGLLDALLRHVHLKRDYLACLAQPPSPTSLDDNDDIDPAAIYLAAQPEMRAERTTRVLHILRNLAMIVDNEAAIATHQAFLDLTPALLAACGAEAVDLLWDVVCQVAKHMKTLPRTWLDVVVDRILDTHEKRSIVLRSAEVLCDWLAAHGDRLLHHAKFPAVLARVIECCSRNRQDAMMADDDEDSAFPDCDDDEGDDDDGGHGDDGDEDLPAWPAPWETKATSYGGNHGPSSVPEVGANMGMVFASRRDGVPELKKIDQEIRDRMLQVLFHLSEQDDATRVAIAKQPDAMRRLAAVVTTCVGRAESARLAVGVLANLSLAPPTLMYFLPIERDLALVALSDPSLADMVANVMADVYGMNSL
ncbi:Aste57867_23107 [Aphanomyces stellatus]|uniref:Aste57867_23107 protein n=1 Tax=Aphanomyces stellatus TaxID=120398 RepID=A0A485LM01_9STRA|nr:hypothetical protein As57867_023036 [Aphanomyces stellatus]VFT99755.1 Aste57867_23107 [Aphanomyces stellatus]